MTAEVRLGDWRDVLPGTYDPTRAIVVTDPPYGLGVYGGAALRAPGSNGSGSRPGPEKGYLDDRLWSEHVSEVLDLLPAVRHVIRGPATAIIRRDYPQPRRLAIEVAAYRRRDAHRPGVVPYLWQAWAIYGRLLVGRHASPSPGDARTVRPYADKINRPTAGAKHGAVTPFAAALWILETWAEHGDGWIVIDPFAGIGTIGAAAAALSIDYLGAEREARWHAVATERVKVGALSLGL